MSFIIHPDYLLHKRSRAVYLSLLERLEQLRRDSNMWIPLPRELNDWWRNRNEMRLIKQHNSWQIEGPEKHRARIPFASLDGDHLVYTFDTEPTAPPIAVPVPASSSSASSPGPL